MRLCNRSAAQHLTVTRGERPLRHRGCQRSLGIACGVRTRGYRTAARVSFPSEKRPLQHSRSYRQADLPVRIHRKKLARQQNRTDKIRRDFCLSSRFRNAPAGRPQMRQQRATQASKLPRKSPDKRTRVDILVRKKQHCALPEPKYQPLSTG